jgi:glycosyltransferase involved in cell wall biosynthesis
MKYRIILFQPFLRKHILNFGKYLRHCEFVVQRPLRGNFYKSKLPRYEKEIRRIKINPFNIFRRIFGILNVRVKFDAQADMFFTYSCMLVTNKPYCVYIENGVSIYNYDTVIAANPIARFIFSLLVRRDNCKKLIFMSEAGKKSFFATVRYDRKTEAVAMGKSVQIYPLIEKKDTGPKKFHGELKLLFAGLFYMKGGLELVHAFAKIREKHADVFLTIITSLHTVKKSDIRMMAGIPGLTLLDADFDEDQMNAIYQSHDVFILPTLREGFGLVLVEALSWGMPIICTDQYATTEVAKDGYNAFVYPDHPLKDYDTTTYRLIGRYYHPRYFYADLFRYQKEGKMRPLEDFLFRMIEKFITEPDTLEKFSRNSLELYDRKFHQDKITEQIESALLASLKR